MSPPGPTSFVTCQYLGAIGMTPARFGDKLRAQASVGRAMATLPIKLQQSFPANTPSTLFVLPSTCTARTTDLASGWLHVVVYDSRTFR